MAIGPIRPVAPGYQPMDSRRVANSPQPKAPAVSALPDGSTIILRTFTEIRINSGKLFVRVVNADTNEVVLEFPPTDQGAMADLLQHASKSLVIDA